MPTGNNSPARTDGLVLRFTKIDGESKPNYIKARVILLRNLLRRAFTEPDKKGPKGDRMALAMGIRLRTTAIITLDFGHRQKTIATVRRADRRGTGDLTPAVFSKKEAWQRTYYAAMNVLEDMVEYADFCNALLKAQQDDRIAVPADHAGRYFLRYTQHVYGRAYQELHGMLLAERRAFDQDLDALEPSAPEVVFLQEYDEETPTYAEESAEVESD